MAQNSGSNMLDLQEILKLFLRFWYVFALCLLIAVISAFLIIKFSTRTYDVGASMLIVPPQGSQGVDPSEFLQGFELLNQPKELQNEIVIMKSTPLVRSVIKNLEFYVNYYVKEDHLPNQLYFVFNETYKNMPFDVIPDLSVPQPIDCKFYLRILNSEEFSIYVDEEDVNKYDYTRDIVVSKIGHLELWDQYRFGETIQSRDYSFQIVLRNENLKNFENKDLYFSFNNLNKMTGQYKSMLEIEPASVDATIINMTFNGPNIEKSVDFVNGLMAAYLQRNLNRKNYLASKTIDYIDGQLQEITDSLSFSERELRDFRKSNQVMDIESKAVRVYQQIEDLENQQSELQRNLHFYEEVANYLLVHKDSGYIRAPSLMGIDDELLNLQVQELAQLNAQKNMLVMSRQLNNPELQTIDLRIDDLKNSIAENVDFIVQSSETTLNEISREIARARYEESRLPQTQSRLLEFEREFDLDNNVFTFLQQKRAEAQIARASNLPDSEIVEPAFYMGVATPRKAYILAVAILLGLLLPASFIFFLFGMNTKISNEEQVRSFTNIPILGYTLHNSNKLINVLIDDPNSALAESFRKNRAKLLNKLKKKTGNVVLVTSTFEKEGKSFNSLNLASSLAIFDKKCILLGMDLRKPSQLLKQVATDDKPGISSFLKGDSEIEDIVSGSQVEHMDIIVAGKLSPNPAELLASERCKDLFTQLKKSYDIIFIDSPPMLPVADTHHLISYADVVLYVTRMDHTPRKPFVHRISDLEDFSIPKFIILNDVKSRSKSDNYRYGNYSYYGIGKKKPAEIMGHRIKSFFRRK